MKKNYLKNLLLCIPIGLMLYGGSVSAEKVCKEENATLKTVKYTKYTSIQVELDDIGTDIGLFQEFSLGGGIAFCLDHGLKLSNGDTFYYTGSTITSSDAIKAYNYAASDPSNLKKRLVAQVIIWAVSEHEQPFSYLKFALRSYYTKEGTPFERMKYLSSSSYNGISSNEAITEEMRKIMKEINQQSGNGTLYIWASLKFGDTGEYQRIAIASPGKKCTPTDKPDEDTSTPEETPTTQEPEPVKSCDIEVNTTNIITSCSSVRGSADEYVTGTCSDTYNETNKTKNNAYGRYTAGSYGNYCALYCLSSITEQYPGSISKAINAGRYIVWPNNNVSSNQYKINARLTTYSLSFTYTNECKMLANPDVATVYKQQLDEMEKYEDYAAGFAEGGNSCQKYKDAEKAAEDALAPITANYNSRISELDADINKYLNQINTYCDTETPDATEICRIAKDNLNSSNYAKTAATNNYNNTAEKKAYDKAYTDNENCGKYESAFNNAKDILTSVNSCATYTTENALDFTVSGTSSYNDPVYGGSFNLVESSKNSSNYTYNLGVLGGSIKNPDPRKTTVGNLSDLLTTINNSSTITYSTTKTYDLEDGYYYYVDKKTSQSTSSKPSGSYSIVGFSNMPVSYESVGGKQYDLDLSISIDGTPFDEAINNTTYTCHYEVTKTTSSECICPSGTKHEGESLDCLISNLNASGSNQYTCSEAKYTYCDSDADISNYSCSLTCPNDASMDLTPCVSAGYSYNYCANTFCNGKKYVCPSGTNEGMNLNACVIPMILKGYSEEEAYTYCKDVTCPYGGLKIIYRTISLQNPFPSYNADKTVNQTGLSVGMFNDTVKGRYPGSNWNSTTVVKSKILNNRNVDGDEVYNQEPLYTFTLTSDTIKAIRAYNKAQTDKYSDFKLTCLTNNSTNCVSDFVHNSTYGLTGGKCDKKLTASNFATCGS